MEDLLKYIVPDADSKFNHSFFYEEDKTNIEQLCIFCQEGSIYHK
jgi:hypothetical protein